MEHSKRRKSHVENRTYKTKQGKKKKTQKKTTTLRELKIRNEKKPPIGTLCTRNYF